MNHTVIEDLSLASSPVSDFVQWPADPSGWEQYRLTQEQLDFFNAYGYLGGIKLLEPEQVEQLNRELAQIADPAHP
ncbi:MAG TPA: phytanoyl-CoA dioxygenase family protein, partial [Agriterribacter sp.]|nr:phytanoyl-CoA dioxygenase family protein [Agriterribacter sp.]